MVVSVAGMRRWGFLAFYLVLAAGLAGAIYFFLHEPIDRKAQRILRRASVVQEEIGSAALSEGLAAEYEEASRRLEDAKLFWDRRDYPACAARAEDALRRFELLSGLVNREFVGAGQIIALTGKVEVQRAGSTEWGRSHEKQALYNGDFVKTASGASAEILFSDGTVYRVGPDSLLEVHRDTRGGREGNAAEVKVKVGQVNVYTALNPSSVVTDAARADVHRDSRVGVEVTDDATTNVAAYAGGARVTGSQGDSVELSTQQAVSAAASGSLSQRRAIPSRPSLEQPSANALVNLDQANRVLLSWRAVAAATGYELQLSRSRLFSEASMEFSNRRASNTAVVRILRPGTYFWRVAALGEGQVRSEWSDSRSFKAIAGARVEVLADTTPPPLEVLRPTQMGNMIIIQGTTEPGAQVTINGEAVEVTPDGGFRKTLALSREGLNSIVIRAIDPAGNMSEDRKQVYVEAD